MTDQWPTKAHIGTFVTTAGQIDLDEISCRSRHLSDVPQPILPPGYRVMLKDIDEDEMAWLYDDRYGVLFIPAQLFFPWN